MGKHIACLALGLKQVDSYRGVRVGYVRRKGFESLVSHGKKYMDDKRKALGGHEWVIFSRSYCSN